MLTYRENTARTWIFAEDKYKLMHLEMFNHGIVHAECMCKQETKFLNSIGKIIFYTINNYLFDPIKGIVQNFNFARASIT